MKYSSRLFYSRTDFSFLSQQKADYGRASFPVARVNHARKSEAVYALFGFTQFNSGKLASHFNEFPVKDSREQYSEYAPLLVAHAANGRKCRSGLILFSFNPRNGYAAK
jgi:hypothetical protein